MFSETTTDFATGDVTISGTAGGTKTGTVTGSGTTYNVAVTGMTTSGTVIASLGVGVATDAAGNSNAASTTSDNTVTYTQTCTWQGTTTAWTTTGNWSCGHVPTSADDVIIGSGGTANPTIAASTAVGSLTFSVKTLTITAGTLTTTDGLALNSGTITVSAGSLAVGGAVTTASGSTLTIDSTGASMSVAGDLTVGGTIAITTGATLSIGGDFTMNGTITPSNNTSTMYTFNGSGAQLISGSGTIQMKNVTVNKPSGVLTLGKSISVGGNTPSFGNLTVTSGTLDLATFTADSALTGGTLTVSNGATLKVGGTNGLPANYSTVTLGATSTFEYSGTNQTIGAATYGNLTTSGSGAKTLNASTVAGTLTIGSGTTVSTAASSTFNGNIVNNGSFTATAGTITLGGAAAHTITGITPTFAGLTVSNASGVSFAGAVGDMTVANTLTLTAGAVTMGANTLIASTPTVVRTSGYVIGNLQKPVTTGTTALTFEVGTGANYTPIALSAMTVSSATGASLTATTTATEHPQIATSGLVSTQDANRYWTLTPGGTLTVGAYTATTTFVNGDLDAGAIATSFAMRKFDSSWTAPSAQGSAIATANTATFSGTPTFGDFAVGQLPGSTTTITNAGALATPSVAGQPYTVTFSVAGISPTGNVTVSDGAGANCIGTVVAGTCDLTSTTAGTRTITATYAGDSNNAGGVSSGVSHSVTAASATQLVFATSPSNSTSQTAFGTQPVVAVRDAFGNTVTSDQTTQVTLVIGTNPGGGTLTGTATVTAINGVATFSGLSIEKSGTGYTLAASSVPSLTGATSNTFNITAGAANKLAFTTQPSGGTGGVAWSTQPTVTVQDAAGNTVTTAVNSITLAITAGTPATGGPGTLACTTNPKAAVAGVDTFAGCNINLVGTGYSLTATATGLTSATSSTFDITVGTAAKLAFTTQPGGGTAGVAWANEPSRHHPGCRRECGLDGDQLGHGRHRDQPERRHALRHGNGCRRGWRRHIRRALDRQDRDDVHADSGCDGPHRRDKQRLHDHSRKRGEARFTTQPVGAAATAALATQPVVAVQDGFGNTVTTDQTTSITLAIGTNPVGTGILSGTVTQTVVNGLASFTGLSVDKPGVGYTLTATSSPSLTGATSAAFTITIAASGTSSNTSSGVASSVTITVPSGTVSGDVLVAAIAFNGSSATTINAPAGWNLILSNSNGATHTLATYYHVAGGSEPASYTFTLGTAGLRITGGMARYTGVDTSNPINGSIGTTGTASSPVTGTLTTTVANTMLIAVGANSNTHTYTGGSGMALRYTGTQTNGPGVGSQDLVQAAAGPSGTKTVTSASTSATYAAQLIALQPVRSATVTSITSDLSTATVVNQPYSVSVLVTGTNPTGTVTVSDGSATCSPAITLSSGTGSCSLTSTSAGSKTITATYSGDTNSSGSSGTAPHTVAAFGAATKLGFTAQPRHCPGQHDLPDRACRRGPGRVRQHRHLRQLDPHHRGDRDQPGERDAVRHDHPAGHQRRRHVQRPVDQ